MESIRAEAVSKAFGKVRALGGVSLEVASGELFFLLGASGCGKTTLLRCIAGLEEPDEGAVFFGGRDVTKLPPHRREAAMVFQSYALWPHLSVAGNIAFGLEERRLPKAEIRRQVEDALERVHLAGMGERSIDQLSGGQQQRVALARALVVKPKCLLLDEPLSNLDARLRLEMRHEIRRIVKENGLTSIYVTHDQEEALSMADRMAVMDKGAIAQIGTPEEIYRRPQSAHVAAFIGETNLLAGVVAEPDGGGLSIATAAGRLPGSVTRPGWTPGPGERVMLSIRPEAWRLVDGPGEGIEGRVVERTYAGQRIQYLVETAAGPQRVIELNPHALREPGERLVRLCVRPDDGVVLPIETTD